MNEISMGLVGCGWAASEIVRAVGGLRGVRIAAAYDVDGGRAEALAKRAGARVAARLDDLVGDDGIDAVYVGLPHAMLAPVVERALRAGRHVLVEKPLALEAETARRLGRMAAERRLKLGVFFELRRAGTVEAARKLLIDGVVGRPRFIRLRTIINKRSDYWGAPGALNWRARKAEAGGGVVLMNSIHQLDAIRYVTGCAFERASGEIATLTAPGEVEDAASATLTLAGGGLLSLAANAHSPGAEREETIEIDGDAGRLDLPDPFGTAPLRLYSRADGAWRDIAVERPDSHARMLADFAEAVRGDGPPPATAEDAAAALEVVLAIYRAAREGQAVEIGAAQVGSSAMNS